ncbi:MAG: hypothetical protein HYY20_00710 [Candidatus Tectomicrobia bacterium]|uniref:Uncharacterized protein n=1 Tax=Tectimicrobiota bacterium TaxID=2528274 RepID=A0A932FVH9_UNCTE|nr:hypothetical protein [Candidatus Tectomicrobia bacterium]
MAGPLRDYPQLPRHIEEYNALVLRLRQLPEWLIHPQDLAQVSRQLPAYERALLFSLDTLNERIRRLGPYNTQWTGRFVQEVDIPGITHLLDKLKANLLQEGGKDRGVDQQWVRRICRSCIERLRDRLLALPLFTEEFKATWPYMRGANATYSGNRMVAGLIKHFGDFNRISIRCLSADPAQSFSLGGRREIRWASTYYPDYAFVKEVPPSDLDPFLSHWLPFLGKEIQFIGGVQLSSLGNAERKVGLRWVLLAFQDEEAARKFWRTRGLEASSGASSSTGLLVASLGLERAQWRDAQGTYAGYAGRVGRYGLILQPQKGSEVLPPEQEREALVYLEQYLRGSSS